MVTAMVSALTAMAQRQVTGKVIESDSQEPVAQTMTQKIAPGETVLSGSFYLDNLDTADTVWVGVSKVVFTDGEIRETESAVYYPCELPSRIQP